MASKSEINNRIKAIKSLQSSRGWGVLRESMEKEMIDAAMAIASSYNMHEKEVDFRRGSIWASHQLLNLPDRLIHRLENELALKDIEGARDDKPT